MDTNNPDSTMNTDRVQYKTWPMMTGGQQATVRDMLEELYEDVDDELLNAYIYRIYSDGMIDPLDTLDTLRVMLGRIEELETKLARLEAANG